MSTAYGQKGPSMLNYPIDQRGENTLYEYLYSCIKRDITHQVLKAGERLPSKRSLAEHLSVSVITVEGAYAQLVAEGYVVSKPRSGYYVAHIPTRREDPALEMTSPASSAICATATGNLLAGAVPPDTARLSDTPSELAFCEPAALHTDTSTAAASDKNLTDAAHLWRRALKQTLAETPTHTLFSPAPAQGAAALRQAIAHYLSQERGLVVNPACIVIGPGAQALYGTLALLAEPHVQVAVEDPGFPALQSVYSAYGISTLPICVDAQGMQGGKACPHLCQLGARDAISSVSHRPCDEHFSTL
ncbi:MAG: aminotransferase class I/II-fold pyridoxal phosphate-dependent enzyme [Atopobiaceae bacterium]